MNEDYEKDVFGYNIRSVTVTVLTPLSSFSFCVLTPDGFGVKVSGCG